MRSADSDHLGDIQTGKDAVMLEHGADHAQLGIFLSRGGCKPPHHGATA